MIFIYRIKFNLKNHKKHEGNLSSTYSILMQYLPYILLNFLLKIFSSQSNQIACKTINQRQFYAQLEMNNNNNNNKRNKIEIIKTKQRNTEKTKLNSISC